MFPGQWDGIGTRYPDSDKSVGFKKMTDKLKDVKLPGFEWIKDWVGDNTSTLRYVKLMFTLLTLVDTYLTIAMTSPHTRVFFISQVRRCTPLQEATSCPSRETPTCTKLVAALPSVIRLSWTSTPTTPTRTCLPHRLSPDPSSRHMVSRSDFLRAVSLKILDLRLRRASLESDLLSSLSTSLCCPL